VGALVGGGPLRWLGGSKLVRAPVGALAGGGLGLVGALVGGASVRASVGACGGVGVGGSVGAASPAEPPSARQQQQHAAPPAVAPLEPWREHWWGSWGEPRGGGIVVGGTTEEIYEALNNWWFTELLPHANRSGVKCLEFFSDGGTEFFITGLWSHHQGGCHDNQLYFCRCIPYLLQIGGMRR
jgi:hypothetical protein